MKFNFVSFENAKELVLRIKALIATHTSNTTIHTTSSEKTKWNAVTNKVDKYQVRDCLQMITLRLKKIS